MESSLQNPTEENVQNEQQTSIFQQDTTFKQLGVSPSPLCVVNFQGL